MFSVRYIDLSGKSYQEAWDYQTGVHLALIQQKREGSSGFPHHLILCEHRPVYTLGKSGDEKHLLLSSEECAKRGIEYHKINRGGDITYHGPGQITGYPILDLDQLYTDVHRYVRELEESIIRTLAKFEIKGSRIEGYTGVWVKADSPGEQNRKICAIGVHLSRWVTLHGFALNVNTDLSYFEHIVPCGIADEDKTVTSMQNELGRALDMDEVKKIFKEEFAAVFGFEYEI
ncbi:MAG: lipoyl(octanoyl) transferase LipB [Saprospiraceae bacterium]|nr:lipoyl(octanoyl) transferase LipB [Saprospiraceae bacterium]